MKKCFLFFGLILFAACTTKTQTYKTDFSTQYVNGNKIKVTREDNYSQSYGIISGIKWGNNHFFNYEFELEPDDYTWKGVSGQIPQKLFFCGDELYLQVKGEKVLIDTSTANAIPPVVEITLYFKNVDKRYFFKLFGDQYFEPIDSLTFVKKSGSCIEEGIPVQ